MPPRGFECCALAKVTSGVQSDSEPIWCCISILPKRTTGLRAVCYEYLLPGKSLGQDQPRAVKSSKPGFKRGLATKQFH
jgi:hypothetical protein